MSKHGIIDEFEAYSEWRKQVRNVIKKYRDVAKAEDLTNANSEQRLNQIISTLERKIEKQIMIYPNENYHLEQFDIFESMSN